VTPDEAVVAMLDVLEAVRIPYMLVGSLASNFHGIPRSTRDADFVVELDADGLERLRARLPSGLSLLAQGAFEAVTGTTRYVIELMGQPFVCELFVRSDDAHDIERFRRRQRVQVLGRVARVATVEDMIITKLRWALDAGRSKDRDDVRNMIAVQAGHLDWDYIHRWAALHGTMELLEDIRRSIPPL
jgi:hypothetical protein